MAREVRVAIIGDPSSLQRALRSADSGVTTFGRRMEAFGSRMRSVGSSLTRGLTLPLVGFGVLAYRELSAGERALAQTEAVIESTGGAARKSVDDILELSASLSELTSLDDEPIQEAANTLLTFRRIAGDTFDEATAATLDLSVAMDRDLRGSAVLVGKALNDPIRGLSALTRVGVTFTDEQRSAIEAMVAFGDTAGAQQVILAELNEEFGGSAEALGGTVTGRLNRLKNRMEELGASILEDLMPALEDLADILSGVADAYSDLTPKQQKFAAGAVALALVAGPLSTVLGAVATALSKVAIALGISVGWVAVLVLALVALGVGIWYIAKNWDVVKSTASNALANITNNVPGTTGIVNGLVLTVRGLKWAWDAGWKAATIAIKVFEQIGAFSFGGLRSALSAIGNVLQGIVSAAQAAYGALQNLLQLGTGPLGSISDVLESSPGSFIPSAGSPAPSGGGLTIGVVEGEIIGRAVAKELRRQPLMTVGVG